MKYIIILIIILYSHIVFANKWTCRAQPINDELEGITIKNKKKKVAKQISIDICQDKYKTKCEIKYCNKQDTKDILWQ
jgi:hypothetical protein